MYNSMETIRRHIFPVFRPSLGLTVIPGILSSAEMLDYRLYTLLFYDNLPLETPSHMLNLFVVLATCSSSQARPFFKR
jgi:hypothetical protein